MEQSHHATVVGRGTCDLPPGIVPVCMLVSSHKLNFCQGWICCQKRVPSEAMLEIVFQIEFVAAILTGVIFLVMSYFTL